MSAPWHRRKKIGRLKISRAIPQHKVVELLDAARHAGVIRRPLDTWLTIRPENIDLIKPEDRPAFWQTELNRISEFCRQNKIVPTYIWSRESDPADGTGEHLHVFLHSGKHREKLTRSLDRRYPGATEICLKPADTAARKTRTGRHHDLPGYIVKTMTPQAVEGTSMSWRKSCPIVGVRAGSTRNIGAKAVAAHAERLALKRTGRRSDPAITIQPEKDPAPCCTSRQKDQPTTTSTPSPGAQTSLGGSGAIMLPRETRYGALCPKPSRSSKPVPTVNAIGSDRELSLPPDLGREETIRELRRWLSLPPVVMRASGPIRTRPAFGRHPTSNEP